jgi:hypothetical protein
MGAVAAACLLVAGCGGGEAETLTSPATSASTTTAAPTTTTTAPPDPGARYLELVRETNCLRDRIDQVEGEVTVDGFADDAEWSAIQAQLLPLYQEYSLSAVRFLEGLTSVTWPPEVQPNIDELITQLAEEAQATDAASAAANVGELSAARLRWSEAAATNPASVIRAKLGLPTNVGDELEYCAPA